MIFILYFPKYYLQLVYIVSKDSEGFKVFCVLIKALH
jgi:hypothetical protein